MPRLSDIELTDDQSAKLIKLLTEGAPPGEIAKQAAEVAETAADAAEAAAEDGDTATAARLAEQAADAADVAAEAAAAAGTAEAADHAIDAGAAAMDAADVAGTADAVAAAAENDQPEDAEDSEQEPPAVDTPPDRAAHADVPPAREHPYFRKWGKKK